MQDPDEFADPGEDDRTQFQHGNARLLKMLREAQVERLKLKDRNEGLSPEEKALFRELLRDLLGSPM
jgi:DNA primase